MKMEHQIEKTLHIMIKMEPQIDKMMRMKLEPEVEPVMTSL